MNERPSVGKAAAVGFPVIVAVTASLFALSYCLTYLLGAPQKLDFPLAAQAAGGALVLAGLTLTAWTFWNRNPANVILSTYLTLTKLFRRSAISDGAGRMEPLVVTGPQKYTRNPLYFGVVVMVFGWALVGSYTFVLVAAAVLLVFYSLLLIPFEEKELLALFGGQWERYSRETPMLLPFSKRRRTS